MDLYQAIVYAHIAAGSVALILFWTAGLMKKGTTSHRRVGQFYLLAMVGVMLSGLVMVQAAFNRGQTYAGIFLGFLVLLVATSCWSSWRAIRDRRDRRRYYGLVYWTLTGLTTLVGVSVSALGFNIGATLLAVFGLVGVSVGIGAVRGYVRAQTDPKWWLKEHYGAMIGNGVATHIAFLGIGLRRLLPEADAGGLQLFAFTAPLLFAVIATVWLNRKYGGRRSARPAKLASVQDESEAPGSRLASA